MLKLEEVDTMQQANNKEAIIKTSRPKKTKPRPKANKVKKTVTDSAAQTIPIAQEAPSSTTEKPVEGAKAVASDEDIAYRSINEIESLNEFSHILQDIERCKEKRVVLTKKEKRELEEITNLASKTRAPLDDRQMQFFYKDMDRFATNVTLPEVESTEKDLSEAAATVKEAPSEITTTKLMSLGEYLSCLKNLIAKREIAWATTTDNDYAQKVEISRLKNEVSHLRVVCAKRQSELNERDRLIDGKDNQIQKLQKMVQKLKNGIIHLEKKQYEDVARIRYMPKHGKDSGLKIMEDLVLTEGIKAQKTAVTGSETTRVRVPLAAGTLEPRKNQGPAALLANALYKARNTGNFVNF